MAAETPSFSSISALLAALTAVLLGAVLLSRSRRPAYRAFVLLCCNLLLWHLMNIFRGGDRMPFFALGAQIALPLSLVGFLRTWLRSGHDESSASARRSLGPPRYAVILVLLAEVGLLYAYSTRGDPLKPPSTTWVLRLPLVLHAATLPALYAALGPLWRAYRSTLSRVDKRRLLYLIGLGALTVTAAALDFLPSPYGRGGPAIGSLLTIVYLYYLQQTLVMDRLLDINELLGKVVVLSAFVLLLSAVQTLLTLIGVQPQQVVTVVAFLILLLYEPLRIFLERQVQRITTRERAELQQSLAELRTILPNVIEPREAVRLALAVFEETRRLTQAAVYLLEADGSGYDLVGHFGSIRPVDRLDAAARRPLLSRLIATRQPVTLEQLHHEQLALGHSDAAQIENLDALARALVELQASAVLGIFSAGTGVGAGGDSDLAAPEALLGVLCIKDRDPNERMSDAFSVGDLDIYAGIAAQLAITLQNSKLYERMKERDRLAALGQMAAGLAHEIRNPLGAIKGAAELIAPGPDGKLPQDSDAADFVGIILEETRRLGRVVSQFLDYARPLRGDHQLIDINDVVRRTETLLRSLAEEMKSTPVDDDHGRPAGWQPPEILVQLAPLLPPMRGDAEQLRQVFLNLGINALQAMADAAAGEGEGGETTRGRLSISTGLRHGGRLGGATQHIEVRFTDTGPGIDPAVQKNLFIPFFTTKEKGTGLGLAISQRIIENHGGFVEVRTRPANVVPGSGGAAPPGLGVGLSSNPTASSSGSTNAPGTTFVVVLPVAD